MWNVTLHKENPGSMTLTGVHHSPNQLIKMNEKGLPIRSADKARLGATAPRSL